MVGNGTCRLNLHHLVNNVVNNMIGMKEETTGNLGAFHRAQNWTVALGNLK
jgi:hypothetical protein